MSSPSTKREVEPRCPECGEGEMAPDVVTKTFDIRGRRVAVEGLLPDRCNRCGALVWPNSELERARTILAVKLRKAAA